MDSPTRLAALAGLALLATGCTSITESRVSVDYYQISGNSTAALDREIKLKGPKIGGGNHAVAVARIRMVPEIDYVREGNACRVSSADVHVDAKVTLPQWTGRDRAKGELAEAWDNVDRYARFHEAVHVAIAFRYAKEMETALLALDPKPNCLQANRASTEIVRRLLSEHDKAQKAFDAREQSRMARAARSARG